jgi:ribosomal protein S18 acetylase RimI-like enzyme
MEFIKSLDLLVIGSRLNTLLDTLIQDINNVFSSHNLDFEPRFIPLVYLLKDNDKLKISDLTKNSGLSLSAFHRISMVMEEKGLIKFSVDNKNPKIKYISLSAKSKRLVPQLELLWEDILTALKELFTELGIDVPSLLDRIESGLKRQSILDRINEKSKLREINNVDIVDYSLPLEAYFKDLNYQWLKSYFKVEKKSEEIIANPEKYILENGGFILFSRVDGYICGTIVMINHKGGIYELAHLTVSEKYPGRQIGNKLMTEAVNKAKSLGAKKIFIEIDKEFIDELRLYKKTGFEEVPYDKNMKSKNQNKIKLELNL